MIKNPFMNGVSEEEGKKRLLEKYGKREILLVNDASTIHGIKVLHERINTESLGPLKMGVKEMRDLFNNLPSVMIDGFKYRVIP